METLSFFANFILHIDVYLESIIRTYQSWTYVLLFLIILCETGLVVTPFLPGDSLLFAAGAFAAAGMLEVYILFPLVLLAAILGDTVNYHIGKYIGPRIFTREHSLWFNPAYLARAQAFYEKHGGKTVILARFIPVMRTFAPFVAGIGSMAYLKFLNFNVAGGFAWSLIFVFGGYFFGSIPFVRDHFSIVILAIIIISCTPLIRESIRYIVAKKSKQQMMPL